MPTMSLPSTSRCTRQRRTRHDRGDRSGVKPELELWGPGGDDRRSRAAAGCLWDGDGRVRDGVAAKGPRVIDLDLLLYDGTVLSTHELSLPHPAMHVRAFVLEPMVEIAPEMVHPVFAKTMRVLLEEMQDRAGAISAKASLQQASRG